MIGWYHVMRITRTAPAVLDLAWLDGRPSRAMLRRVHAVVRRGWPSGQPELVQAVRSRLEVILADPALEYRSRARVRWILDELARPFSTPAERLDRHKRPRRAARTGDRP
jgi:hypothetical protein